MIFYLSVIQFMKHSFFRGLDLFHSFSTSEIVWCATFNISPICFRLKASSFSVRFQFLLISKSLSVCHEHIYHMPRQAFFPPIFFILKTLNLHLEQKQFRSIHKEFMYFRTCTFVGLYKVLIFQHFPSKAIILV